MFGQRVTGTRGAGLMLAAALAALTIVAAAAESATPAAAKGAAARGGPPPAGRYRCYLPPNYTVTAWFDLESDGRYRLQGVGDGRFAWDGARSLLRWSSGDFADGRSVGVYMPPGAVSGDEDRATIVLAPRDTARPGKAGWDRLQRCYLTTH